MSEQNSAVKIPRRRGRIADTWHRFKKNKGGMIGLIIIVIFALIALTIDLWVDYDTQVIAQNISERLQGPSLQHLFGTDESGRDIFVRILYGSRFSLTIGAVAVMISVVIGVPIGAVAGYFGGRVENILMRITDIFGAVPPILLGIVIVAAFDASTITLMVAVGVSSIPQFIRITRASVLTVRNQDFIESARAIGLSEREIIFSHILPNCLSPIIVQVTLRIASAIISASSLSFLGMGIPAPAPEWGNMLSSSRNFLRGRSYMTFFPGLAIMVVVLAFNMIGDSLRDALDPKLKK